MPIIDKIKVQAAALKPDLIEIRRHIHMNPELSFKEFNTAVYVENYLGKLGIKTKRLANTGIVALIEGKNPNKKVVGLRADMDALPIVEVNDNRPYRSLNEGVMHACGHDVHTTSLMGTANIINGLKDQFEGTIKLVFQPGEEKLPGGASLMINEGVLDNPKVDVMIGQHVMPQIPAGLTGFRSGLYMASTDELYVTISGKGGHGAMPHFNVDPVLITAHIIVALQQIVSRVSNPATPSVLSFGKVLAMGATNVIPSEVKMEGTFRTLDEKWRTEAHAAMKKMAEGIAESMGGICDFKIVRGYPFLKNDVNLTDRCRGYAEQYLGKEQVSELGIWMAAEDFAYYSQEVPSCFYRLGVRNEAKGIVHSVHNPAFDADEDALENGCGLFAYLALAELGAV
jgi:amidohydrolase